MGEQATKQFEMPAHGAVCWTELSTKDAPAAKQFYSELFGWTFKESQSTEMKYTEFSAGGRPLGGIYQMTEECVGDGPAQWMSYIAVDDVDASAKRTEELGGKLKCQPMDIPNTGRFCVIEDPTGATIALITFGAHCAA